MKQPYATLKIIKPDGPGVKEAPAHIHAGKNWVDNRNCIECAKLHIQDLTVGKHALIIELMKAQEALRQMKSIGDKAEQSIGKNLKWQE